jgi:hypothetical protein
VGAKISWLEKNSYWDYFTFDDAAKVAPAGYHIPAQWELVRVINILCELGIMKDSDDGENFSKTLKLPLAGFFDNLQEYHDSYGYYRSSSPLSSYAYSLYFHASLVSTHSFTHRSLAFPVRCFKDSI